MQLPVDIRIALERMADGQSLKSLGLSYKSISDRYRGDRSGNAVLQIRNADEALAYAIARMPATYGAVHDVLLRAIQTIPTLKPVTLLDLGAGPGTATLAALEHFHDLKELRLVEPNTHLAGLSKHLCRMEGCDLLFEPVTLSQADLNNRADLVMLSYVLNEIPEDDLYKTLDRLWDATKQALVIIEPGTPDGYNLVMKIRDHLLKKLGARIAAPCPHDLECPLRNTSLWCHMSARIERTSLHRKLKSDATLGYEDEKFSYLVATRLPSARPDARVIGHPHGQKLISLELCEQTGHARTRVLSKRDEDYKTAKKLEWGDAL